MGLSGVPFQQVGARSFHICHGTALNSVCQAGLAADLPRHLQQHRCTLADALHLFQILRRSRENRRQGAVALHQLVGNGIGVPSGNGIIQQQLQRLMICKAFQPAFQKALPHFLPVSLMDIFHADPFLHPPHPCGKL